MNITELRSRINEQLKSRNYYGMFELINQATNAYLGNPSADADDYKLCIELINQNQDLYEYMGASKQFESAFELINQLAANRNKLFMSCLTAEQRDLKVAFKKIVGDYSNV